MTKLFNAAIAEVIDTYGSREALQREIKAASYNDKVDIAGARHLVTGGCFLVYDCDIVEWLHNHGSDRRIKDTERNWNIYVDIISRAAYKLATGRTAWQS